MTKSDRKDGETLSRVSTHNDILELIEEIKDYEKLFPEYNTIEPEDDRGGFSTGLLDENNLIEGNEELITEGFLGEKKTKPGYRKIRAIRIRRRKSSHDINKTDVKVLEKKVKEKKITPTTFNVGFDGEGNLVNLDIKKPKIKPKSESRSKKLGGLKRFRRGKKSENVESTSSEKTSKVSKLKGALGKIGKLKNVIPHRGKNKEKGE